MRTARRDQRLLLATEHDYRHLPEPIRLEDTITSEEAREMPREKDDYWREVEWMLRTTGLG